MTASHAEVSSVRTVCEMPNSAYFGCPSPENMFQFINKENCSLARATFVLKFSFSDSQVDRIFVERTIEELMILVKRYAGNSILNT